MVLKPVGTAAWASDRLKVSIRTSVGCPGPKYVSRVPSGPAALRALTLLSAAQVSVGKSVGGGGLQGKQP